MCFLQRVLAPNRVLLAGQRTELAQAGPAPEFGPGGDAGVTPFLGQGVAVLFGSGAEPGSGAQLRGRARVAGTEVTPANLFAMAHEPDPIPAPAALDGALKTSS